MAPTKEQVASNRVAVLLALQKDARRSSEDIARECGVSEPTFHRIRAALEREGLIRMTVAVLDRNKLGFQALGFFKILCSHFRATNSVAELLKVTPGVLELHVLDGTHQLFAKICAPTPTELSKIQENILKIGEVSEVRIQIAMKTILETTRIPI